MNLHRFSQSILRSPVLWGTSAGIAFYYLGSSGFVKNAFVLRYLGGSWVNYVETGMFFVGIAALVFKAMDIAGQLKTLDEPLLPPVPAGGQPIEHCGGLLESVATGAHAGYLRRRLRDALEYVHRKGSAEGLDEEVKYLSDIDAVRSQQSYAFLRIIIWAIPIMGFLGTVIGITVAIANLSPGQLESSLPDVTAGLGMAFDTTAIALGFSVVLMFGQYAVDRAENNLLSEVDARTSSELIGRFQETGGRTDPQLAAVRRMVEAVLQSTERLVERQAELWQATIDAAHARWSQLTTNSGKQLESALTGALNHTLKLHVEQLTAAEQNIANQNRQHWTGVQQAFAHSSETAVAHHREICKQGEVLLKIADATRQVAELENTLNSNLQALAGAKNFEETVMSLSAAIHLLSAKLGSLPSDSRPIELSASKRSGQAA